MTEKPHHVWVPRGYFSKVKIKDDDVQMVPVEELEAVQNDKLEAIKKAFINYFGDIDTDVINNKDFESAQFDPCDSYYFANATRKILGVEE